MRAVPAATRSREEGAEQGGYDPKCKWGRHYCRPHSHRRVDTPSFAIFRRTFRIACSGAYLAPDVWPLRVRSCDFPHWDSSPALAPASGFRSCPAAVCMNPKIPLSAAMRSCLAETAFLYRSVMSRVGLSPFRFIPFRPGSRPVRFHRVAPFSNDPACIWPKPPACRLSMSAWTDVTAISGIKTRETSRPCGFPFRLFCVPKTS